LLRGLVRDQQRRRRGHTRTMSAEGTGLRHHRANPLGNSATGCRRPTASPCRPAMNGGPPARPPKALVAIRRPIIAAIWNMLTSGQPGHVVGATTARAAARKPQAESSRKSQKSRRADPAGSLGEHRPTRRYWGHLTELADPSHARVRQPDPLTAAAPDEPSGAPLRPALRAASLTCQLLTSSIGPSLSERPYRLTSGREA
jgi:hypothetical protein